MKKITLFAIMASLLTLNAGAGNLWIVGDATPYGWSLDDATALLSTPENPSFYTGTIYLTADANFKFMSVADYGDTDYPQYGAANGASLNDGEIALAAGMDEDFTQIQVNESGNYYITVDTEALVATLNLSSYQATEIGLCSLFLVGDATQGGWSVDDGTPLYQNNETPYVFSSNVNLKTGEFKIATVMKGAGSWDPKYYYFADPSDPGKIILNNDEDTKWNITKDGSYLVEVNILAETISITESDAGVSIIENDENAPIVYYNLGGLKVSNPEQGIYIRKQGKRIKKVIFK